MTKLVTLMLFLLLFRDCSVNTSRNEELVFDRLVGTWQVESDQSFERWNKNSDSSFTSVMYTCQTADTNFSEKVKVYKEHNNWIFETLVNGQNNGQSVKFTSEKLSNNGVTFRNPAHDFPKTIHYTLESDTVLRAFIAGGTDTIRFNFKKVK